MHLLRGPNETQMDMIRDELNEDAERIDHLISVFHKWIAFQPHLPKNIDPKIIPTFLRGCKHDIERAKRKLELYFSVRKSFPDIYSNRDPTSKEILLITRVVNVIPLPNLTKDGFRITINKLSNNDAALFDVDAVVKYFIMMGDIRLYTETPISGDIYIMDLGHNLTVPHLVKGANNIIRKAFTIATEAYPQRIKKIHVVNAPNIVDKFLILIKSLMKEKLRDRFVVHRSVESLIDYISPDCLPAEYGGTLDKMSVYHENWKKALIDRKDWFREQESIVTVGPIPKHLSHSCALDSTDSIQGSFRQLTID